MEQLPFIPNQLYNRRNDIHIKYGGSWQRGICPSTKFPYIFIFSGSSGKQHGYKDGWINDDVFTYTGEGQSGDMQFTNGNLALRDHLKNEKRVFLFEGLAGGLARFIDEVVYYDFGLFESHDTSGKMREAIKFFFNRKGTFMPLEARDFNHLLNEKDEMLDYKIQMPNETERKGLVTSRVGQGAYRKGIIHRWEYKCAVTGFDKLDVLIASHILPWSEANDDQRLDVHNGILLSPTYDALFDKHFISFENNGKIILSDKIETKAFEKIGVIGNEKIKKLNEFNYDYLEKHRLQFN